MSKKVNQPNYVPKGMTEERVLEAIEKVVKILSHSFTFGYFDRDDIEQQARLFALNALRSGKYRVELPLENFLYAHCKNRLINFRRDNYRRNDPPCAACHRAVPGRTEHPDGQYCEKYRIWRDRNDAKASIMRPLDIGNLSDEKEPRTRYESDVEDDVQQKEILERIDAELPVELRSTYLQMRAGQNVSKTKRQQVEAVVKEILASVLNEDED